jgi:hypothetical protein
MTEATVSSHLYVISISNKFISSHFTHADYEYAIGSEQSREHRKIQGQKHFGRFFMFFRVCFVFDDYLTDIKLKMTSRRHEYSLEFRALQNPEHSSEIGDTHVNGGTDPMELLICELLENAVFMPEFQTENILMKIAFWNVRTDALYIVIESLLQQRFPIFKGVLFDIDTLT